MFNKNATNAKGCFQVPESGKRVRNQKWYENEGLKRTITLQVRSKYLLNVPQPPSFLGTHSLYKGFS